MWRKNGEGGKPEDLGTSLEKSKFETKTAAEKLKVSKNLEIENEI